MKKTLTDGRIVRMERWTYRGFEVWIGATQIAFEYDYDKALEAFILAS